jgi:hypothetical protein
MTPAAVVLLPLLLLLLLLLLLYIYIYMLYAIYIYICYIYAFAIHALASISHVCKWVIDGVESSALNRKLCYQPLHCMSYH